MISEPPRKREIGLRNQWLGKSGVKSEEFYWMNMYIASPRGTMFCLSKREIEEIKDGFNVSARATCTTVTANCQF